MVKGIIHAGDYAIKNINIKLTFSLEEINIMTDKVNKITVEEFKEKYEDKFCRISKPKESLVYIAKVTEDDVTHKVLLGYHMVEGGLSDLKIITTLKDKDGKITDIEGEIAEDEQQFLRTIYL